MRIPRPLFSSALTLTAALALAACGGSQAPGDGATAPSSQMERATEQATGGAMTDQSPRPSGTMTDDDHSDDHDGSREPDDDHSHDRSDDAHDHSDDHDHSHEPDEDHSHDG